MKVDDDDVCSRNLKGAEVTYVHGAEIARVDLHTDFSAVQISGLTVESRLEPLQKLLSDLGFPIPLDKFRSKTLPKGKVIVAVKMQDPEFAKKLVAKFNKEVGKGNDEEVEIKQLQLGMENESLLANKLQMSSVICSWFRASTTAWLHYSNVGIARGAERILNQHGKILGRKVQIKLDVPSVRHSLFPIAERIISVQVGNLDTTTRRYHFTSLLRGKYKPNEIVFGQPSHHQSELGAERIVRVLLQAEGMESWESISTSGTAQAKASARFDSREAASEAVKKLNKSRVAALGGSQIFLSHVSSVKFSVPVEMAKVLEGSIMEMQLRLKESGHTHLMSYPPAPSSRYAVLRISGQDVTQVARAKSELERLLNGNVVEIDGSFLWDPYFATAAGNTYLRELHTTYKVYIHRDTRKHRLAVYGGSIDVATARDTLRRKMQALSELSHTIVLTPELLQKALSGGLQAIVHKFGKANATLDIAHQPKTIKIRGSMVDFQAAQALLLRDNSVKQDHPESKQVCSVCWDDATDPFRTPCHHTYCTECFTNQCISATDSDNIPIRCYGGDSANCTHIFSTTVLQKILPTPIFEQLLESSFTTYIRTHPQDFQYCPTPDCSQIFRISSNGINFDCPACLASICTNCALVSHDGLSCATYKELVSEGNEAFEKYKADKGIKDCPKCSTPIEKTFGCNHMECLGCRTHICWFCMDTFGSGQECYKHMNLRHSGIGY